MNKTPSIIVIWSSVALLALIWGSTWLVIKIGLIEAPPFFSAALRFIIASLFLLIYMKAKRYKFPVSFLFWKRSALFAFLMFIIPYGLVYWGEMYISSGLASVLFSSQSLFVVLFAHYMLNEEKATVMKWFGLVTGMGGLIYIFYARFELTSGYGIIGMSGLIVAALSAGFGLVWLRKLSETTDHIIELTAQACITALFFTILSPLLEEFPRSFFSPEAWLCITYLAIIGTAFAFLIYYWLIKYTSALITSFTIYFTPVLALFFGWLILGEFVGINEIIGTLIVIISIIITQINGSLKHSKKRVPHE